MSMEVSGKEATNGSDAYGDVFVKPFDPAYQRSLKAFVQTIWPLKPSVKHKFVIGRCLLLLSRLHVCTFLMTLSGHASENSS
jgi:hypothetical protein